MVRGIGEREMAMTPRPTLAPGTVQVTPIHEDKGWCLVEIGRARYTKRFNLSRADAAQLRDLLDDYLAKTER